MQPKPSSSRYFARSWTSRGIWSSVGYSTHVANAPVDPFGSVACVSGEVCRESVPAMVSGLSVAIRGEDAAELYLAEASEATH